MEEINSFADVHEEVDPPTYGWWEGAIPANPDRPTTWHYVPVFCRNRQVGRRYASGRSSLRTGMNIFQRARPSPMFSCGTFDVRNVQQWRAYWVPNPAHPNPAYSIFVQFHDNDKPFGRAIHFGPTPSQVNKVTLGAVWNQNPPVNPGDPPFGEALGGFQVEGTGRVWFSNFAVEPPGDKPGQRGTFVMSLDAGNPGNEDLVKATAARVKALATAPRAADPGKTLKFRAQLRIFILGLTCVGQVSRYLRRKPTST
jgi:hypothetical protein